MITVARTFDVSLTSRTLQHRAAVFTLAQICESEHRVLSYDNNGQPYLPSHYVSIAHSSSRAVAAISDHKVGVDIEIANRVLSPSFEKYVIGTDDIDVFHKAENTLLAWVIKESVLKMRGQGITKPPRDTVNIKHYFSNNLIECQDQFGRCYVTIKLDRRYIMAIAYERNNQKIRIY